MHNETLLLGIHRHGRHLSARVLVSGTREFGMIDGANLPFLGLVAILLCVMVALCLLLPLSDDT